MALSLLFLIGGGCGSAEDPEPKRREATEVSRVPLRVLLPADDKLASAIETAWQGVSEQPIELTAVPEAEIPAHVEQADVILLPTRFTGDAVAGRWIVSLPESWLEQTGGTGDFLPALQDQQMRFGSSIYGLSLGSPIAVIGTAPEHAEELRAAGEAVDRLALVDELRAAQETPAAVEALAGADVAYAFLLRSASRVDENWLFDRNDMTCQFAVDPNYQQALNEVIEVHKAIDGRPTVAEVTAAIEAGAVVALQRADATRDDWICLPIASDEVTGAVAPLVMHGSGMIACLARACRQSGPARVFLRWVSGTENVASLADASPRITVNRSEEFAADSFEAALVESFSRYRGFRPTLRLRGADRYQRSLVAALEKALDGSATTEEALQEAATAWDAITEELGMANQRNSWLLSQGLPPIR